MHCQRKWGLVYQPSLQTIPGGMSPPSLLAGLTHGFRLLPDLRCRVIFVVQSPQGKLVGFQQHEPQQPLVNFNKGPFLILLCSGIPEGQRVATVFLLLRTRRGWKTPNRMSAWHWSKTEATGAAFQRPRSPEGLGFALLNHSVPPFSSVTSTIQQTLSAYLVIDKMH